MEGRVLGILEDRSGKLNEILEIERELSRVREEIERMEGRIRFLKERTSLATITIRCREQQEYQPAAAPTLTSRLGQSFSGSIETMQRFVANLMVFVAAVLPWAIVLLAMSYVIHRSAGDRIRGWLANRSEATSWIRDDKEPGDGASPIALWCLTTVKILTKKYWTLYRICHRDEDRFHRELHANKRCLARCAVEKRYWPNPVVYDHRTGGRLIGFPHVKQGHRDC